MAPKLARNDQERPRVDPRIQVDAGLLKKVYLVTFPHPRTPTRARLYGKTPEGHGAKEVLRRPAQFTRADIVKCILDAAEKPVYDAAKHQHHQGSVDIERMVVFMERHKPGRDGARNIHYHVALQGARSFRFAPLKRAIRSRYSLETHWSTEHEAYFSAVRYGALPSERKPVEELDPQPELWAKAGVHQPLFEACQQPVTFAAIQKRRENAVKRALEAGKPEPRPTQMDLYAAIVGAGIRNTADDQHAATKLIEQLRTASPSLYAYAFKIRSQLPAFINDVWAWESAGDTLSVVAMPRMQRIERAAKQPCICGGMWRRQAERILRNNSIDPVELFTEVHRCLFQGRGPATKALVLAGKRGGEGKSFLLGPLREVFGAEHVQESPQPGNFPLLGLESKSVVLLDEWRFDENVLLCPTQLLWLEGKPFPIPRPQNQAGSCGHWVYRGTAPIFITTKAETLEKLQALAAWAERTNSSSEHTMLLRRLRIFMLSVPTPVPDGVAIPDCASCFAAMVLRWSTDRRGLSAPDPQRERILAAGIDPDDI